MSMKTCKHCDIELVLGDNWARSFQKTNTYKCSQCHYQRTKANTLKWKKNNPDKVKSITNKWKYNSKGVYGIFSDNECLYIGESTQLNNRISNHKSAISNNYKVHGFEELYANLRKYNDLEYRILEECDNHKEQELHYIQKFQPVFNSNLVA